MPTSTPPLGHECGICLQPVSAPQCPDEPSIAALPNCNELHDVGSLCEGDGECGTDRTINNCGRNHDVYQRCASELQQPPWSPPRPPTLPPAPLAPPSPPIPPLQPLPPCLPDACIAGASCGICLRIAATSECPSHEKVAALPRCSDATRMKPGFVCEADGECGTDVTLNNCAWHDVYVREACVPATQPALDEVECLIPEGCDPAPGPKWPIVLGLVMGSLVLLALLAFLWFWHVKRRPRAEQAHSTRTSETAVQASNRVPLEVALQVAPGGGKADALIVTPDSKGEVVVLDRL